MKLIITFARKYPLQSTFTVVALLFASIAEGFGITALLPLLNMVLGQQAGAGVAAATGTSEIVTSIEQMIRSILGTIGLTPTVAVLLVFFVACIMLKCMLVLFANRQVGYTVAHVATDLRLELLRALFVTRWEYFIRQPVGMLTNAVATEAARSAKAFLYGERMAAMIVNAFIYAVLALVVSWKATLAAVVAGSIIVYLLNRLVRKARRSGRRQTRLLQSLLANLTDSLQSIKPLKAMAREDAADSILKTKTNQLNRALQKQVFSKEALKALQEPLFTAFLAFGLFVALVSWKLPLSLVLVTIYLVGRVIRQMQKVQSEYQDMAICDSAYWSLQDKISEANQVREETSGSQIPSLEQDIRLDQVSFAYDKRPVLENASLTLAAGTFTAVVGPSGAGKTTVADLVIGLLRPQQGEVWIDNLPLAQVNLRSWRRMIGYVPQETLLLHDTIFINVTLGDKDIQPVDVEGALRAAGAWEFVSALPKGVNSVVGERGHKLSGGQRQRIAIARALVHRPKLLILDEATTALDPANERAICKTLEQLRGGLTILAISHQPAVLEVADLAYRLKNGKAVPVGEVRAKSGVDSEVVHIDPDLKLQVAADTAKSK
jgi:ATP-binding cassette subfamily C protein